MDCGYDKLYNLRSLVVIKNVFLSGFFREDKNFVTNFVINAIMFDIFAVDLLLYS